MNLNLLAGRRPAYRRREPCIGLATEQEKQLRDAKGKAQSPEKERPKVPMRATVADRVVVVLKPL